METARILIADDEPNVRFIIERTLAHEGYKLDTAISGADAIEKINTQDYDLLLLDIHMPPIDGLQVLQEVKAKDPNIVVILLTGYGTIESAVEALRLGAFDYLFKPASPQTIRERIKEGLASRQQSLQKQKLVDQIDELRQALTKLEESQQVLIPPANDLRFIRRKKLVIDRHHRAATFQNQLLDLTTTEFDLLLCLVEHAPEPVPPQMLVSTVMGYETSEVEAKEIIKWHIFQLRRKLEPDPQNPAHIVNIRYKGYLWRDE